MLKVLLKNAIKSPSPRKVLALCFIVYFASISFVVASFLLLLAGSWLVAAMKKKARTIIAAEAEAEAASLEVAKPAAPAADARTQAAPVTSAAANDSNAQPAPMKQYAKSAVVLPFKTGTQ